MSTPQNPYGSQPSTPQYGSQPSAPQYGSQPGAPQFGAQPQYGSQPAAPAAPTAPADQFVPANPGPAYGSGYQSAAGYSSATYPAGSMGGNTSKNIWGILALIGGIVGLVGALIFGIGFLPAVLAVIFGFIGLSAAKKGLATNRGLSITGIILGFVSAALSIVVVIMSVLGFGLLGLIASSASSSSEGYSSSSGYDPAGSGSSTGSDSASDFWLPIATDVSIKVSVYPDVAGPGATGAGSTNGEVAVTEVTVKNDSSSSFDLNTIGVSLASASGAVYPTVLEAGEQPTLSPSQATLPADDVMTVTWSFAVPAAEVDSSVATVSLTKDYGMGTSFEF